MEYPLVFNSHDEHVKHVKENKDFYRKILLEDPSVIDSLVQERYEKKSATFKETEERLKESRQKLEEEKRAMEQSKKYMETLQQDQIAAKTKMDQMIKLITVLSEEKQKLEKVNEKQKEVSALAEKKQGEHSMYKGKFHEEFTHMCLDEAFPEFVIEGKGQTRCMDKRMVHRFKNYTLGVECKDKGTITTADITKFRKDSITNQFKGCIFISTSKIVDIVEVEDDFKLVNNELFIYSKNREIIVQMIKLFINYIETDKDESKLVYLMGDFKELYKQWISTKKSMLDFDKFFWTILEKNGINLTVKGNVFLAPASKCKSGKVPY